MSIAVQTLYWVTCDGCGMTDGSKPSFAEAREYGSMWEVPDSEHLIHLCEDCETPIP